MTGERYFHHITSLPSTENTSPQLPLSLTTLFLLRWAPNEYRSAISKRSRAAWVTNGHCARINGSLHSAFEMSRSSPSPSPTYALLRPQSMWQRRRTKRMGASSERASHREKVFCSAFPFEMRSFRRQLQSESAAGHIAWVRKWIQGSS